MRLWIVVSVLILHGVEAAISLGNIGGRIVSSLKSITGFGAPAVALPDQHSCAWAEHESGACASTSTLYEVEVLKNGAEGGSGAVVTVDLSQKEVYDAFSTFDGIGAYFAAALGGEEELLLKHMRGEECVIVIFVVSYD